MSYYLKIHEAGKESRIEHYFYRDNAWRGFDAACEYAARANVPVQLALVYDDGADSQLMKVYRNQVSVP